jgi:hypothetical protein
LRELFYIGSYTFGREMLLFLPTFNVGVVGGG